MKGTFRIATISGIPLRIHWTFLLIFIWVAITGKDSQGQWEISHLSNLLLSVFTLFACVILHELGHAFMARRFGIKTQNIVLLPIGGVAILERMPIDPQQELKVAFAGPAVNFLIALIFLPWLLFLDKGNLQNMISFLFQLNEGAFPSNRVSFINWFIFFLVSLNVVVGAFNLIPAMPMDGGRILRAFLSTKMPRYKATKMAAIIGAILSGFLVIYSVIQFNWILVFIGLYIFTSAFSEFRTVKNELFLVKNKVKQLMDSNFSFIHSETPLSLAIKEFELEKSNYLIIKNNEEKVIGILTEKSILEAVKNLPENNSPIGSFFLFPVIHTGVNESLQNALHAMYENEKSALTVMEEDQIKGVIDRETIHHFLK